MSSAKALIKAWNTVHAPDYKPEQGFKPVECHHPSVTEGNHPDEGYMVTCNACLKDLTNERIADRSRESTPAKER